MSLATAIIDTITAAGYEVEAVVLADGAVVVARRGIRSWRIIADDLDAAAIELARDLGFELEE